MNGQITYEGFPEVAKGKARASSFRAKRQTRSSDAFEVFPDNTSIIIGMEDRKNQLAGSKLAVANLLGSLYVTGAVEVYRQILPSNNSHSASATTWMGAVELV